MVVARLSFERVDRVAERLDHHRIEARGRLVEDEDRRSAHQRLNDADFLLHPV